MPPTVPDGGEDLAAADREDSPGKPKGATSPRRSWGLSRCPERPPERESAAPYEDGSGFFPAKPAVGASFSGRRAMPWASMFDWSSGHPALNASRSPRSREARTSAWPRCRRSSMRSSECASGRTTAESTPGRNCRRMLASVEINSANRSSLGAEGVAGLPASEGAGSKRFTEGSWGIGSWGKSDATSTADPVRDISARPGIRVSPEPANSDWIAL